MKIYSMYDIVSCEYGTPFTAINYDDCKRKLAYSQQSNPFCKDIKVFYVGDFCVDTGTIVAAPKAEFMFNLIDIVSNNVGDV